MDLKPLAWFFEDDVEQARSAFLHRCTGPDAETWLGASQTNLMRSLFGITHRILVAHYKLIEGQVGFDAYCASLRQPDIRAYLHERYPLLRSAMDHARDGWVEEASTVFARYAEDREAIASALLPGAPPAAIREIRFGAGDHHRGGRSVAILEFTDGRKLVYKPRDMSIDTHFARLLDWVNARCGTDLCTPAHLERAGYGWAAFVAHAECADADAVGRFYARIGNLLAMLYILEGYDFHYENIIAAGEHPVLIDLESFFRPPFGVEDAEAPDTSVLKVGILPNRIAASGDMPEISGLSDTEGQLSLEGLFLVRQGDDSVALIRSRGVMPAALNVPMLDGARIQLEPRFAGHVADGFARVYRAILDDNPGFTALIEQCADSPVRVLFRHTAAYAHVLEESRHPSLMASEADTARHFDLLRLGVPDYPAAERFVGFEIADLRRGDVPMFTAHAGGRDLWHADDAYIPDFFPRSGLDMAHRNLARLSAQDLERQLWIIGNCFAAHATRASARGRSGAQLSTPDSQGQGLSQRLIGFAGTVASHLREQMHVADDTASWLVHLTTSIDNSSYSLVPAFYDIYGGMPGEILFFSQLSQVSGDFRHMQLAQKALNHLNERVRESSASIRGVGLYGGWGSLVRMFTALAELQSQYAHFEHAESLLADPRLEELIAKDRNFSIIKGSAGLMIACSEMHMACGSTRALALAEACAEHLFAHRWPESDALAWRVSSRSPLSGLAHGASGFALAFARLYEATGAARYRDAALSCLDFERTLFVPEAGNWEDRRDHVVAEKGEGRWCSTGWSHGAPGIGLARLGLLRAGIDTPRIREELDVAVATTRAHGFDGNDSLIFGNFGNLELLICHRECFPERDDGSLARIASGLLERCSSEGMRLNAPAPYPLGMLAGATGIAYQCLRLARMQEVPSVLCGTSRLPAREDAGATRRDGHVAATAEPVP